MVRANHSVTWMMFTNNCRFLLLPTTRYFNHLHQNNLVSGICYNLKKCSNHILSREREMIIPFLDGFCLLLMKVLEVMMTTMMVAMVTSLVSALTHAVVDVSNCFELE